MKSIRVSIDFDVEYDNTEPGAFAYAMAVVDELLSLEIDGDGVKIVQTRSIRHRCGPFPRPQVRSALAPGNASQHLPGVFLSEDNTRYRRNTPIEACQYSGSAYKADGYENPGLRIIAG